jgi:hypothetical protein
MGPFGPSEYELGVQPSQVEVVGSIPVSRSSFVCENGSSGRQFVGIRKQISGTVFAESRGYETKR